MSNSQTLVSQNPATEEIINEFPIHTAMEVNASLQRAAAAQEIWRRESISSRAEYLKRIATELRNSLDQSARLITAEMGKSITEARAEVEKCAIGCEFYAEHGPAFLEKERIETPARNSYIRFDPLGCVLAVMPWNFPFWQVLRFAAPTLLAGNVGLLKHASNVTGCALAIEQILQRAGLPEGVFGTLVIPSSRVSSVVEREEIRAVSLTGSEAAGSAVAEIAGKKLKKQVLELGGSDPFIVLEDADLDLAVAQAVKSRTINCGQSCIAAKRFIVVESVYAEFVDRMTASLKELTVGDPLDETTDLGPLARKDLRDDLHKQVQTSIQQGARLTTGGKPIDRTGYFYEPTLLADATPEMLCFHDEVFGPVASVASVSDAEAALKIANASQYGLAASLWTQDIERAEELAARVESGGVFINEFPKSDPHVPFGGVKNSGYGRELSWYGIREFVNVKTIWIG